MCLCARQLPTLLIVERASSTDPQLSTRRGTKTPPSLHLEPQAVGASSNQSSTHVSFTQPFLRLGSNPAAKKKSLISPSPSRCHSKKNCCTQQLRLEVPHVFEPSHLSTTTRPVCVCRTRPTPARMSTDRPTAEWILSRAPIGFPNRAKSPCKCSKSVKTHDCSKVLG